MSSSLSSVVDIAKEVVTLFASFLWFSVQSVGRMIWPADKKSLSGRIAVVTGAGHGIGREFALQLSRLGVVVMCWDVDLKSCSETVDRIQASGGTARAFPCDVSDRKQVARAASQTRQEAAAVASTAPISLLFNNAGILKPCKPFLEQTPDEIKNIFNINVFSQMWLVKEFFDDLASVPDEAHIVSMSSTAGLTGTPNMSTYCSTKYAINGFMEALFLELREMPNLCLTTVYPFTINTGLARNPMSRFPWLIPFTDADKAVRIILDGVRRNKRHIYIPGRLEFLFNLNSLLPFKFKLLLFDFLGCGVIRHRDEDIDTAK